MMDKEKTPMKEKHRRIMENIRQPKTPMIQIVKPITWAQVWEHYLKPYEENVEKIKILSNPKIKKSIKDLKNIFFIWRMLNWVIFDAHCITNKFKCKFVVIQIRKYAIVPFLIVFTHIKIQSLNDAYQTLTCFV